MNNTVGKKLTGFWLFILACVGGIMLLFFLISIGLFGKLPTFDELENPQSALATELYSADGKLIGKYYLENRSNVDFENLPAHLVNALVATEDIRYSQHAGIDFRALARVVLGVVTGNSAGGGSTITQQLAKNLFPRKNLNKFEFIIRKFKEWIIAVKLEKSYTKEEILTMYLNTVPFSDNAFGIKSATRTYFNKEVDSLRVEEAAVLVGMLKAPSKYNPRRNPNNATDRRNVVIGQMAKYDFISDEERDTLLNTPLVIDFTRNDHHEGLAPYFRENLRQELKRWCAKNPKVNGEKYDLYNDGLKVYTTIDSRMQKYAEEAAEEHLSELQEIFFKHWKNKDPWKDFPEEYDKLIKNTKRYKALAAKDLTKDEIIKEMKIPVQMKIFSWKGQIDTLMSPIDSIFYHRMFLQCGFMAMDPESGYVKAWVGGINHEYFQYDHVNINTKRQIGSTFKPFVYAVAIREKGYSPCFQVPNEKITFEKENPRWSLINDWTPKNATDDYGGMYTLKKGLAKSINVITARLMYEITPGDVVKLAHNMGIESKIDPFPSICLGTPEISVYEMVGAYGAFANKGVYTKPIFIMRIEDKNGNILEEFPSMKKEEAIDEQTAFVMVELLRNVVNIGTAIRLRYKYGFTMDIAGKTGTTQNHSDGWFMGFTPELVGGTWVGCEDRYVRFRTINYGQGASLALPIWANFFEKVYEDPSLGYNKNKRFEKPKRPLTVELDCSRYEMSDEEQESEYGSEFE